MYRILRAEAVARSIAGARRRPCAGRCARIVATGPNQLWSWDITYLKTPVRGVFLYLYLMIDVWSREDLRLRRCTSVGFQAAALFPRRVARSAWIRAGIVLHADNGGPMKGATMVATLERLGVLASFSRPRVSNDNAFSESLFRTMKYRPDIRRSPSWISRRRAPGCAAFVRWYNTQASPQRDSLRDARRSARGARRRAPRRASRRLRRARVVGRPTRWSGATRNWEPIAAVSAQSGSRPAEPSPQRSRVTRHATSILTLAATGAMSIAIRASLTDQ